MNMDFATVMVALTALSGGIWAFDAILLAPKRRQAAMTANDNATTEVGEEVQTPMLVDYARSFFPIFLIVLLLRSFLVEPFRIPSGSMMPTLLIGDFILVNKYNYGIRLPVINKKVIDLGAPKRGDIVVFRYPEDPSIPFIKRIVGVPGDHIVYKHKQLMLNDEPVPQQDIGYFTGYGSGSMMTGAIEKQEMLPGKSHDILIIPGRPTLDVDRIIPEGHYLVFGDNRDNSKDSRYWGLVPDENLIGRAFMIWMNWDGGVDFSRLGQTLH